MNLIKNPWVTLAIGVILGGTLLANYVQKIPGVNKIPKLGS